eukprot:6205466-Pleurochrysis_carterae.AAC.3
MRHSTHSAECEINFKAASRARRCAACRRVQDASCCRTCDMTIVNARLAATNGRLAQCTQILVNSSLSSSLLYQFEEHWRMLHKRRFFWNHDATLEP